MCQPRPKKNCFLAHLRKKKIHPALSLSREEAQHARLRCARAVPRWLESVAALWKPTVPARRLSSSVHGRAPTCQTRPQTSRFLAHVRKKPSATARALSAGRRRSTLAGEVHAPRRAGWSRFLPYGSPQRQQDGLLRRCTAAVRRASRGLKQAGFLRMCARNQAPPRALSFSREGAARARTCGVRASHRAGWDGMLPYEWPTAPARRPSSSVHGRAPTCQPRPATSRILAYVRKKPSATARALSAGRRRRTLAGEVRTPRRAGWSRFLPYGSPQRQRDGPLPRCTVAIPCASRGLQQAAFLRMCAR